MFHTAIFYTRLPIPKENIVKWVDDLMNVRTLRILPLNSVENGKYGPCWLLDSRAISERWNKFPSRRRGPL